MVRDTCISPVQLALLEVGKVFSRHRWEKLDDLVLGNLVLKPLALWREWGVSLTRRFF